MKQASRFLDTTSRTIVANAGSMVGTTAITSGLGFAYWWLAARQLPPDVVGLAAAIVSAMSLLGIVGMLGLGTLVIAEMPRRGGAAGSLLSTSLLLAALAGVVLGIAFAVVAPLVSPDLRRLATGPTGVALFALGVGLTATGLILDQALIGLLRGELQLLRNGIFAFAKLVALLLVVVALPRPDAQTVQLTWVLGLGLSLGALAAIGLRRGIRVHNHRPRWEAFHGLGGAAVLHHALNVALQAPNLALPVLVTVLLSATTNAYFYAAWMMAGFVFVGPVALTTAIYAVGARAPAALASKLRFTLGLSLVGGALANAVLLVGADRLLELFGASYAAEAGWALRIVALGVFPLIVKDHFVAICRVRGDLGRAARWVTLGGLLELGLAATGAVMAGLPGLTIAWVAALCLEAVLMAGAVYRTAAPGVGLEKSHTAGRLAPALVRPARGPVRADAAWSR